MGFNSAFKGLISLLSLEIRIFSASKLRNI